MIKKFSLAALTVLAMICGGIAITQAYHVGTAHAQPAVTDVGSGSGSAVVAPPAQAPHDKLHDPTEDPGDFVGDLKDAKKKGWLGVVLVGLYGLLRLLGKAEAKLPSLAFLNKGRTAMIIAAVGTMIAAGVDALFTGGTLVTVGVAMLWSMIGLITPGAKAS